MTEAIAEKYLGLPSMIGLDKSESFMYLLERIIERLKRLERINLITGWEGNYPKSNYSINSGLCYGGV
jgi:hypothetical protein